MIPALLARLRTLPVERRREIAMDARHAATMGRCAAESPIAENAARRARVAAQYARAVLDALAAAQPRRARA